MRDRLVKRLHDPVAFGAHVGRVDAAVFRRLARQRDQFIRPGIGRRRILQRRRQTHGTIEHCLAHQRLHAVELSRVRCAVVVAEDDAAHLRRADVAGEIDAHSLLLEMGEELTKRSPVRRDPEVVPGHLIGLDERRRERRRGAAFAGDFGGDALEDLGGKAGADKDGDLRLAEHVDEARRDDLPGGVDDLCRRRTVEPSDGRDVSVLDRHVAGVPGSAGAIDDPAMTDEEIVAHRLRMSDQWCEREREDGEDRLHGARG